MRKGIIAVMAILLSSCYNQTCEELKQEVLKQEFFIVVKSKYIADHQRWISGHDRRNKVSKFAYHGFWDLDSLLTMGDTMVKKRGELTYLLRSRSKNYVFHHHCQGYAGLLKITNKKNVTLMERDTIYGGLLNAAD